MNNTAITNSATICPACGCLIWNGITHACNTAPPVVIGNTTNDPNLQLTAMTDQLAAKDAEIAALKAENERLKAPVSEISENEIEIGFRDGFVTAGPFLRPNCKWTPEQAEIFASFLVLSAKSARAKGQR